MTGDDERKIKYSDLDKIIFPSDGITKEDLVHYYRKIARIILPHLQERALTMHRFPGGIEDEGFYQQEVPPYFPSWIGRASIAKKEGGSLTHVVCNDKGTLLYLANQACITAHVWLSRISEPDKPDKMIFDLDPQKGDFRSVVSPARALKKLLEELELPAYLMNTGSKGVHVVVPIKPQLPFDQVRHLAVGIASRLVAKYPREITTEMRKKKRGGRLYVDCRRNSFGITTVAPYSVRALAGATVAAPLDWEEFDEGTFHPQKYNIYSVIRRLGQKEDPWKDIYKNRVSLKQALNQYEMPGGYS
ncbi:MAG: hypothetical protein AVO34_09925 [Firmicutes bacterium ML8_F2]|nr:MAG: hypothetical protein AVO34_09925 [Firmicutes bacterium ML8_F2]